MKRFLALYSVIFSIVAGCQMVDYEAIMEQLRDHENRIEMLEVACNRLNSNIEAMQVILEALQTNDYVTDVVKIMEDGVEIGYSITFAESGTVTIYNGTDGNTPKIGIRKAADGGYYWTADEEWLTDEDGNKIPAVYSDSDNGKYITPLLRVADGIWYVSYDNGNTWRQLGEVEEEQEDFFQSVSYDEENIYLILSDGTEITIPRKGSSSDDEAEIPEYWKSHIDSKICEINKLNESQGGEADSFIFITDTHYPNNKGNALDLIRYIMARTSVDKVFIGGDLIEGTQGNAADVELLRSISKEWDGMKVFPVRGNHDAHKSDITDDQWYDAITRRLGNYCNISDKLYYHYDNTAQKIRYIFADSVWGYDKYASSDYLISDEQLEWIKDRILELPSDWTVLITKHHLWSIGNNGILNSEGKKFIDHLNTYYSEAKCTIAGVFAGHSHGDYHVDAPQGYIMTTTIGDNKTVSGWKDNSTKEHAFDVVSINPKTGVIRTIRIGDRGTDREFKYAVNAHLPLSSLSLNHSSINVSTGKSRTLTAVLQPNNTTERDLIWSIEDGEEFIEITPEGISCKVTGLQNGHAVIKVRSEDNGLEAVCNVSVKDAVIEDITDKFVFTDGRMIYAHNGGDAAHSGWMASDYTDIERYSMLEIKMSKTSSLTSNTGLAFYDADKKYISGVIHIDGIATYGTMIKELEVPANAKYIRTTYWSRSHSNYKEEFGDFYCKGIVSEIASEDITNLFSFQDLGPVISTDGTTNDTNKSSYHSNYVDISSYYKLSLTVLTTTSSTSVNGLAFYDDSKQHISGVKYTGSTATYTYDRQEVEVPYGAKYIRTTWWAPTSGTNSATGAWTSVAYMTPFNCVGYIKY